MEINKTIKLTNSTYSCNSDFDVSSIESFPLKYNLMRLENTELFNRFLMFGKALRTLIVWLFSLELTDLSIRTNCSRISKNCHLLSHIELQQLLSYKIKYNYKII